MPHYKIHGNQYKNKWFFRVTNDWNFVHGLVDLNLLGIHLESHAKWVTILGFSFVWERNYE